ncbi:hypothetical protein Leryth_026133 [Lithospermum erythrorhizon]|nr:hypothetical protein Leryth_026133 [Lithospermum erythrorhizon]
MSSSSSSKKFETRKRDPDPRSSVLLVIDMQNHFYSIAKTMLPEIKTTIELCRKASIPIIYTRHCHKSPSDHGMLHEWWDGDLIFDGTTQAEIMLDVARQDYDLVVEKNTYNAFLGTKLEDKLKEMGAKEVIVSGVMTNLCCETTARDAFVRGFRVFFSTDATTTSSKELHEATLKNMAYGFAYLVDCKSLEAALSTES